MLRLLRNKRAQTTAEYAILIALVVAAVVGMQTYVKRGLQARYKDVGDDYVNTMANDPNWGGVGGASATLASQYEHDKISSNSTQDVLQDDQTLSMQQGGTISRDITQRTQQAQGDYRQYDYNKE